MGIESTMTIKRSDAISMLNFKSIEIFEDDCNDRLASLIYEHKESDFENYQVVNDDYVEDEFGERWKFWW